MSFFLFPLDVPDNTDIKLPKLTTATVTGISVAVAGNVLISLALNLQKLAHRKKEEERLELARRRLTEHSEHDGGSSEGTTTQANASSEEELTGEGLSKALGESSWITLNVTAVEEPSTPNPRKSNRHPPSRPSGILLLEREPLIPSADPTPEDSLRNYGAWSQNSPKRPRQPKSDDGRSPRKTFFSRFMYKSSSYRHPRRSEDVESAGLLLPVEPVPEEPEDDRADHMGGSSKQSENVAIPDDNGNESDYLKSKLWWLGFLLMNVGEMGNFISYAFAPASVVAPLGTFALIANCFFAPVMLGEHFRKLDIFGILVAVIGAITVVLSSNTSETRLDPAGLLKAISQQAFIIYTCIYVGCASVLAILSEGSVGRKYVFVDVGLCALFGGFTVLSTKGVSTLITLEWIQIFTEWITYPIIIVLVGTGVGQIRYLNRALMRFDSKVVIPIQFVLFNLSAILGSAILYGDFKRTTFHQFVTFLYGCAATFAGVFMIAWAPPPVSTPTSTPASPPARPVQELPSEESLERSTPGSFSRRRRNTLALPPSALEALPTLHNRHSSVSLMGLSPAQGLVLVHTPPRDGFTRRLSPPEGHSYLVPDGDGGRHSTPDSIGRRRAISWFGDEGVSPPGYTGRRSGSRTGYMAIPVSNGPAGDLSANSSAGYSSHISR